MPLYCFICTSCGHQDSAVRPISKRDDATDCPKCHAIMARDIVAEGTNTPMQEFHRPIEMYSVAPISTEEVAELRRKLPDVKFNDLMVPVAHSRHEKMAILKATGFQEGN